MPAVRAMTLIPDGDFELVDRIAQLVALFALDAPRDAAAAWIVGHQYQVAAGERDIRGERSALVASLVLVDLDDQLHPFAQLVVHSCATAPFAVVFLAAVIAAAATLDVLAGDFLERQKAVTLGTVIDEARFEAGLDAGDDGFVDVAFALFLAGGFDIEIDQFLAIDDRHPELFRLGGVEQHAFHSYFPGADPAGRRRAKRSRATRARGDAIERRTPSRPTARAALAARERERTRRAHCRAGRRPRRRRGNAVSCLRWTS
jgi:hypothetical protein